MQVGKRVGSVIVDRAWQDDPCTTDAGCRDRVVQHRQDELAPIAVTRRVDGMDDDRGVVRCGSHIGGDHRIAALPDQRQSLRIAVQSAYFPAPRNKEPGYLPADTAGGA